MKYGFWLVACLLSLDTIVLSENYNWISTNNHNDYGSKYGPNYNSLGWTPQAESQLVAIQMLFRHGKRTQTTTWPTDKFSPNIYKGYGVKGFGQLMESGALEGYELGKYLRTRYIDFIAEKYLLGEIYPVSSDFDRAIMGALSTYQGMYPRRILNKESTDNYGWGQTQQYDSVWFPVRARRVPVTDDNYIAQTAACPNYDTLFAQYLNSSTINTPQVLILYKYLTEYSGATIQNYEDIYNLYDAIFNQQNRDNGLPVAQWAQNVKMQMLPLYLRKFYGFVDSPDMLRYIVGPMMFRLQQNFECARGIGPPGCNLQKVYAFSVHDTTITPLLILFGKYDKTSPPPYNSALLFELRKKGNEYYVLIYYRPNSSGYKDDIRELLLDACHKERCTYSQFKQAFINYTLSDDQWKTLCNEGA